MITEPAKRLMNHGRNVRRIREMLGVKQDELANLLHISPSELLQYEQKEVIEESVLTEIATVLNVPLELITNFKDDTTMTFVSNTFRDMSMGIMGVYNTNNMDNCTFNPIEKIITLFNDKVELYERLLKAEQEKVALLQKQMEKGGKS